MLQAGDDGGEEVGDGQTAEAPSDGTSQEAEHRW